MKKVFERVLACNDMQVVRNCVSIIADNCEIGMNDGTMLETMKQVQGEIGACHYDEEMAKMHLCLIGQLHTADVAKDYWHEVDNDKITIPDWLVLWGEMVKRNDAKIKKWFPKCSTLDFEKKILDECVSFLGSGQMPFYDLKV